jgi:hypothetical protein
MFSGVQRPRHSDQQSDPRGNGPIAAPPDRHSQSAGPIQHRRLQESCPRQGQCLFLSDSLFSPCRLVLSSLSSAVGRRFQDFIWSQISVTSTQKTKTWMQSFIPRWRFILDNISGKKIAKRFIVNFECRKKTGFSMEKKS